MNLAQKSLLVRIGDFFFKYRNALFPAILLTIFLAFTPPDTWLGSEGGEEVKDTLALLMVAAGLAIRAAVIGFAYIKRGGLNKQVYADTLVTQGFFATCRNPLYVGNMLIYTGIFLMHGHPYVAILGPLLMFAIYTSIIAAEEYFLHQKFGPAYDAYCRDVPRWLPRLSRLKNATQDMRFNAKRVLLKDYTTIANSAFALVMIESPRLRMQTARPEPR